MIEMSDTPPVIRVAPTPNWSKNTLTAPKIIIADASRYEAKISLRLNLQPAFSLPPSSSVRKNKRSRCFTLNLLVNIKDPAPLVSTLGLCERDVNMRASCECAGVPDPCNMSLASDYIVPDLELARLLKAVRVSDEPDLASGILDPSFDNPAQALLHHNRNNLTACNRGNQFALAWCVVCPPVWNGLAKVSYLPKVTCDEPVIERFYPAQSLPSSIS